MFYGSISPPGQGPLGLPELRIFEISDNNFTGSLPPTYFVNWKASSLTMNENGHIPLSFSNLSNLESLDLSSNQLSWTIPNGLSFWSKARLCGLPLQETCFVTNAPPTQPPKQEGEEENEEVFSWKGVAIGLHLGFYVAFASIFAYPRGWIAQMEVWSQNVRTRLAKRAKVAIGAHDFFSPDLNPDGEARFDRDMTVAMKLSTTWRRIARDLEKSGAWRRSNRGGSGDGARRRPRRCKADEELDKDEASMQQSTAWSWNRTG
ncbi:hypothetical protein DY000_02034994 [Brassica cretica]|uniref:Leucine-rich repeat-containing N-terminal plant-type domain-containing protein n=1 Tax=Brassica cretica TaxID=69181 RepID=A0ABQ7DES2_BRACR|nr:hypothetical protein DY000_02034994 [Brassica cretica]